MPRPKGVRVPVTCAGGPLAPDRAGERPSPRTAWGGVGDAACRGDGVRSVSDVSRPANTELSAGLGGRAFQKPLPYAAGRCGREGQVRVPSPRTLV